MTGSPPPSLHVDVRIQRGPQMWHLELTTHARCVGISGPSGAGKTTLLRVLAGLEKSAQGTALADGRVLQDATTRLPAWERQVGWVPQDSVLFPHASVRENLSWAGACASRTEAMAVDLRVQHLLSRHPRHLSGGERQRVAIGRALLSEPRLLLFDEPFSALDLPLARHVADVISRRAEEHGALLIVVSHDASLLDRMGAEHWHSRSDGRIDRARSERPNAATSANP